MTDKPTPKDVDAAISMALGVLSDDESQLLIKTNEDELIKLSLVLGAKVRNGVGLWRSDAAALINLLAAADPTYFGVIEWGPGEYSIDVDGASGILLRLMRKKLISMKG